MKRIKVINIATLVIISIAVFSCGKDNPLPNNSNSEQPSEETIDGRLSGVFSVSENVRVRFSQGNLQYCAAQNLWRFAEEQYDYIGEDNERIAVNYSGWIDLFGWGTSGWASGATCYEPWATSNNSEDYFVGGDYKNDLTGTYKKADWGVFNQPENSRDDIAWRTLSYNEWTALIGSENLFTDALPVRQNKSGLGTLSINGVTYNGLILVPDDWSIPDGCEFIGSCAGGFSNNTYSEQQWEKMEANGAVFLPCSGYRRIGTIYDIETKGHYWTTTAGKSQLNGIYYSNSLYFYQSQQNDACAFSSSPRGFGFSVRLVTEDL